MLTEGGRNTRPHNLINYEIYNYLVFDYCAYICNWLYNSDRNNVLFIELPKQSSLLYYWRRYYN